MMLRFTGLNPVVLKNDDRERISPYNAILWSINKMSNCEEIEKIQAGNGLSRFN